MNSAKTGFLWAVRILAASALLGQAPPDPPAVVGSLASADLGSFPAACECDFYRGGNDGKDAYAIAANPENLVFQTRRERSLVFANVLGELRTLELADRKTDADCRAKSRRFERWKSGSAEVVLDLRAIRAGAEACWYRGRMRVTAGERSATVRVIGACGC